LANENWGEVWDISTMPTLLAKAYRNIITYGNHFRVASWSSSCSMVTYDCGVMNQFEHSPPMTKENPNPEVELIDYVGECQEILELDYGFIKVNVLLCTWVQPSTQRAHIRMKRNKFGFLLVNFKRLFPSHE
jgi:hypothetical protein